MNPTARCAILRASGEHVRATNAASHARRVPLTGSPKSRERWGGIRVDGEAVMALGGWKVHGERHELWMWQRIVVVESCWEWVGEMGVFGYGYACIQGTHKRVFAHRAMYELLRGPIPDGMDLDHLCRNRRCVNPEHLEPVTHRENCRRGNGWSGRNARKTHCKNGHALTPDNLVSKGRGRGTCSICAHAGWAARNARVSAARKAARPAPRTHCPLGHALIGENAIQRAGNHVRCRECNNAGGRARRAAKKAASQSCAG